LKKETVITIEYGELEDIVNKAYSITDYEFVAVEECGNDSSHRFDVGEIKPFDPENVLDKYDLEKLEKVKAGKVPTYSNHIIFRDLVNRGILEPGTYIVEVSW
jgi:hypothetical protein